MPRQDLTFLSIVIMMDFMSKRIRIVQSILLIICSILLIVSARIEDRKTTYVPLPESNDSVYNIGVLSSNPTHAVERHLEKGFVDALNDSFGEKHINVIYSRFDDGTNIEDACQALMKQSVDLIFTEGNAALEVASLTTLTHPIIATDVISIQRQLHIADANWDGTTGRNITGLSSLPNIADQLSLLIESTPDLKAVGLLYHPDDKDALYQNEILERYLDEADIPWKEYELRFSEEEPMPEEEDAMLETVVYPQRFVARSGKEGANIAMDIIGSEDVLDGIIEPESVRKAKTSAAWPLRRADLTSSPDQLRSSYQIVSEISSDTPAKDDPNTTSESISWEIALETALEECDALYLSSKSLLSDQVPAISEMAAKESVVTVGGDAIIGENTLVSTFHDPYDQGYRAGKIAYRILIDNEAISEINVSDRLNTPSYKLYQNTLAQKTEREFPKSFYEIDGFLSFFNYGVNTSRVNVSEDSK